MNLSLFETSDQFANGIFWLLLKTCNMMHNWVTNKAHKELRQAPDLLNHNQTTNYTNPNTPILGSLHYQNQIHPTNMWSSNQNNLKNTKLIQIKHPNINCKSRTQIQYATTKTVYKTNRSKQNNKLMIKQEQATQNQAKL